MAVLATTKGGWDRASIGLELVEDYLQYGIYWLPVDMRQYLILEELGLDVRDIEIHNDKLY